MEKKIISWILLALLSVYIVPKELFHAFHSHIETRDKQCEPGKPQFDTQHSHCYLLQFEASNFIKEESQASIIVLAKHYCFIQASYDANFGTRVLRPFLRGPPISTL